MFQYCYTVCMKKGITFVLLVVFFALVVFNFASAWGGFWGFFAGKVISAKATEVEEAEASGYTCDAPETFTLKLVGSLTRTPTSFAVGPRASLDTRSGLGHGKATIGVYGGQTLVTCKRPIKGEDEKEEVKNFSLTTVSGPYGFSGF